MPILGYLMTYANGKTVSFFGLFTLPRLISENQNLGDIFFHFHQTLGYILFALITLHIAAALHHHFILKDIILKRMLPFTSKN